MRFLHPCENGGDAREREAFLSHLDSVLDELRSASTRADAERVRTLLGRIHPALDAEVLDDHGSGRLVVITPHEERPDGEAEQQQQLGEHQHR